MIIERIETLSPAKIDLYDREASTKFEELKFIRDATTYTLDMQLSNFNLTSAVISSYFKRHDIGQLAKQFYLDLSIPTNHSSFINILHLYEATSGNCYMASRLVMDYLETYFPGYFSFQLMYSADATYFFHHYIAVIHCNSSGRKYALSPANAFNSINLTLPTIVTDRGIERYWRVYEAFYALDTNQLIDQVVQYEGGTWELREYQPITQ